MTRGIIAEGEQIKTLNSFPKVVSRLKLESDGQAPTSANFDSREWMQHPILRSFGRMQCTTEIWVDCSSRSAVVLEEWRIVDPESFQDKPDEMG